MNGSVISILNNSSKENSVLDFKIVKSLLRYVLFDYYPAINWEPNGIFLEDPDDSVFSLVMKSATKIRLDAFGGEIHSFYDEDFPRKDIIRDKEHLDSLKYLKYIFESKPFDNASFLDHLCMCAEYAALSYLYGVSEAPITTLHIVCITIKKLRETEKIREDFWNDFEKFCEMYVQTERRRGYVKKHE